MNAKDIPTASWANPSSWPKGGRENVFLAEATHLVGEALFPEDWTGNEWETLMAGHRAAEFDRLVGRRWSAEDLRKMEPKEGADPATDRFRAVMSWIAEAAINADVETRGRSIYGGTFSHVDASEWSVEPLFERRFCNCTYSVSTGWDPIQHYLFLDRQSLEAQIAKVSAPDIGEDALGKDVWLSPYMTVMVAALRQLNIGPDREQTPPKDAVVATISEIADRHGVEMSNSLMESAATLLRHPDARLGKGRKEA